MVDSVDHLHRPDPIQLYEDCPEAVLLSRIINAFNVGIINPKNLDYYVSDIRNQIRLLIQNELTDQPALQQFCVPEALEKLIRFQKQVNTFEKEYNTNLVLKFC